MKSDLLAVDQMLLTAQADTAVLRAGALSLVFANAAARAEANQAAASDAGDPKAWADSFSTACLRQLGGLGWRITEAGHTHLSQQTSSLGGSAATTLAAVLGGGGSAAAQSTINALRDLAGDPQSVGNASPEQAALLSFWWGNAANVALWLFCGLGALSGDADTPALALDLVQLDLTRLRTPSGLLVRGEPFQPASIADLFVDVALESISVVVRRSISANLDNAVFGAKRGSVETRLGDKFADHYRLSSGASLGH